MLAQKDVKTYAHITCPTTSYHRNSKQGPLMAPAMTVVRQSWWTYVKKGSAKRCGPTWIWDRSEKGASGSYLRHMALHRTKGKTHPCDWEGTQTWRRNNLALKVRIPLNKFSQQRRLQVRQGSSMGSSSFSLFKKAHWCIGSDKAEVIRNSLENVWPYGALLTYLPYNNFVEERVRLVNLLVVSKRIYLIVSDTLDCVIQ